MDVIKLLPNWLLGIGLMAVAILVAIQMFVGGAVVCSDGTWFGKCSMESRLLASAILLTQGECKQLGDKWSRFEPAAGRFAIASGEKPGYKWCDKNLRRRTRGSRRRVRKHTHCKGITRAQAPV